MKTLLPRDIFSARLPRWSKVSLIRSASYARIVSMLLSSFSINSIEVYPVTFFSLSKTNLALDTKTFFHFWTIVGCSFLNNEITSRRFLLMDLREDSDSHSSSQTTRNAI
jgi:hypothetical protein